MRASKTLKGIAASGALALAAGLFSVAPAQAADDTVFCSVPGNELAMAPASQLTPGEQVNGLTTVSGTTPSSFTGKYLTKLDAGLGYDADGKPVDLLMVELSSPEIDGAGKRMPAGIWAGMSGSPVYDENGALIGAVAYGFSSEAINVAGVTPASEMKEIGKLPGSVKLSGKARGAIANEIDAKVPNTVRQLQPVRVSTTGLAEKTKKLKRVKGYQGVSASGLSGTGSTSEMSLNGGVTDGADYPIVPGGNIAVSYGFGAVTEASVGTVTAVCGDEVYAYGHPNSYNSKLKASFHGASAAVIVPSAGDSYKQVSGIGKALGSITQDRLAGVKGKVGALPEMTTVSVTSKVGSHRSVSKTHVSERWATADIAWQQLANDATRMLDNGWEGSAKVSWAIAYQRANGKTGTLKNINSYSAENGFPDTVGLDIAGDIAALETNEFERVRITDVKVSATFSPDYQAAKVTSVELKTSKGWKSIRNGGKLEIAPGKRYALRAKLTPVPSAGSAKSEFLNFKVTVPKQLTKSFKVGLTSNEAMDDLEALLGDLFSDGGSDEGEAPKNLTQLLNLLDQNSRADQVRLTQDFQAKKKGATISYSKSRALTATQVVVNSDYAFDLKAKKSKKAKPKSR